MTARKHISRRKVLKILGISGAVPLGSGIVTADHGGTHPEPTFFARLSDNPSIPGHDKVNSRGKGRLDLVGGEEAPLTFEVAVRNLEKQAAEIYIRGEGSAEGPPLVKLYGETGSGAVVEGGPFNDDAIQGTIEDGDVIDGDVSGLIWDELVERNGVVTVHTGSEPAKEIAGIIRPRPVGGWIVV